MLAVRFDGRALRALDQTLLPWEERDPGEVRRALSADVTVVDTSCRNPAFDVTPARMITALVTERGVARPVDGATVRAVLRARP